MKKYVKVRWSEIAGKAIIDYLSKLEEGGFEMTTRELLEEMGEDFKKSVDGLSFEKAVEGYKRMRHEEWERLSTTQLCCSKHTEKGKPFRDIRRY